MTDWESRYRAGDTPWNKGAAHPALLHWLDRQAPPDRVLVPGCGLGHDVRALATRGACVTGLDIAPSAIQAARELPTTGTETYVLGDFFDLPAAWEDGFDAIFEHTCFCAIDPADRPSYAASAARLLRPGGSLIAIFYLNPGREEGPPFGCDLGELDRLFGAWFSVACEERDFPTFPGREGGELFRVLVRRDA
jgi:SAM-dependent methyltransferase